MCFRLWEPPTFSRRFDSSDVGRLGGLLTTIRTQLNTQQSPATATDERNGKSEADRKNNTELLPSRTTPILGNLHSKFVQHFKSSSRACRTTNNYDEDDRSSRTQDGSLRILQYRAMECVPLMVHNFDSFTCIKWQTISLVYVMNSLKLLKSRRQICVESNEQFLFKFIEFTKNIFSVNTYS